MTYLPQHGDDTWQLILSKALVDNGWILNNPHLGAPGIAHWYDNPAAQTSAMHSIAMRFIFVFVPDAVAMQQIYFLLNFSFISLATFFVCRALKITPWLSFCVGLLYSLTSYRFDFLIYSFLPNYYAIPFVVLVVYYVMLGLVFRQDILKFTLFNFLLGVLKSRRYWYCVFAVVFIALSDGYYAFFTLLLLGFSVVFRLGKGDWRRPRVLFVPATLTFILMAAALSLAHPLAKYKQLHPSEFAEKGVVDPVTVRHPFEAEVYSSSLKLLLAPSPDNRLSILGKIGTNMVESSVEAQKYTMGPYARLGPLGSVLLICSLLLLVCPWIIRPTSSDQSISTAVDHLDTVRVSMAASVFILLTATNGGIGPLLALVYPVIRAYNRFPIFLSLFLYIGAASLLTAWEGRATSSARRRAYALVGLVVALNLAADIPRHSGKRSLTMESEYIAERNFVRHIESRLPAGAMVYQYPYSAWLIDSPYYGWGSFGQIRLYLFSKGLRWSNGASKHSPEDAFHEQMSQLPAGQLFLEMQAAGFSSVVIDRSVVGTAEYRRVMDALQPLEDGKPFADVPSKLTYVKLRDPGYRLEYTSDFRNANRIVISDPKLLLQQSAYSSFLDDASLRRVVEDKRLRPGAVLSRAEEPDIFARTPLTSPLSGDMPVEDDLPQTSMQCTIVKDDSGRQALRIVLGNQGRMKWDFGVGRFPFRIGMHVLDGSGRMVQFDTGFRVNLQQASEPVGHRLRQSPLFIAPNERATIDVPVSELPPLPATSAGTKQVAFQVVQEQVKWFSNLECEVTLPPH